jgi:hypothetical protein
MGCRRIVWSIVAFYQTTWRHIPEDNPHIDRTEYPKSHVLEDDYVWWIAKYGTGSGGYVFHSRNKKGRDHLDDQNTDGRAKKWNVMKQTMEVGLDWAASGQSPDMDSSARIDNQWNGENFLNS